MILEQIEYLAFGLGAVGACLAIRAISLSETGTARYIVNISGSLLIIAGAYLGFFLYQKTGVNPQSEFYLLLAIYDLPSDIMAWKAKEWPDRIKLGICLALLILLIAIASFRGRYDFSWDYTLQHFDIVGAIAISFGWVLHNNRLLAFGGFSLGIAALLDCFFYGGGSAAFGIGVLYVFYGGEAVRNYFVKRC